jgi:hypothetical protein
LQSTAKPGEHQYIDRWIIGQRTAIYLFCIFRPILSGLAPSSFLIV